MGTPAIVIIVLIVLIGTGCLNEATPFSLINVAQILCISIMEKPCCRIHRPDRHRRHSNA